MSISICYLLPCESWRMNPTVVVSLAHLVSLSLFACILPAALACRGCTQNPADAKLIKDMRIEAIKQRILDKLRLTKPPIATKPRKQLPKTIFQDMFMYGDERMEDDEDVIRMDEFYAKESQMVIFAETASSRCGQSKGNSACLTFTLPPLFFKKNIQSAALHLHVRANHPKHQFSLKDKNVEPEIDIRQFHLEAKSREGWQPIDITGTAKKWAQSAGGSMKSSAIQLVCEDCDNLQRHISLEGDFVPFLVVQTDKRNGHRNRRGLECHPQVDLCCRESLFVNFTDIGWDSWIIEPRGYAANYCKGSCNVGLQMPAYHHSSVVQINQMSKQHTQSLLPGHRDSAHAKALANEIVTCCAPTRMSAVTLLFYDGDGVVHKTILPNMSVDSCGCS